jgi:hypothetical protein
MRVESDGATVVHEQGPTSDTYTLVLATAPEAEVVVWVDPDGQLDLGAGAGAPVACTFTDATWDVVQTVTVTAVDDGFDEGPHTGTIKHTVVSGDPNYSGYGVADTVVSVADNDTAGVTIVESAGSTDVDETAVTSDTYTVVLDSQPTANVVVTAGFDANVDLGSGPGTEVQLAFTPGNWNIPRTVIVWAVDDGAPEGPHSTVIVHSIASGDPKYNGVAVAAVTVNVTDDDVAGVTICESNGSTDLSESGVTSDSYTVVLVSPPAAAVVVTITPDGQADLGGGPATPIPLAFTAADWNVAQAVTVTAVDDAVAEGPHTATIRHAVSSSDPNYDGMVVADVTAHITDNDTAGISVVETDGSTAVSEGSAAVDRYAIVLLSRPAAEVVVTVRPDSQTDLGAGPATPIALTFAPADWQTAQSVAVRAVDDLVVEGAHRSTIRHEADSEDADYRGLLVAPITVEVADNDSEPAPPELEPLVADAGPDITMYVNDTAVLDGSGSRSNIGARIVEYTWRHEVDNGVGLHAQGMVIEWWLVEAGSYAATLTVTDDRGNVATDMIVVHVVEPLEPAPCGPLCGPLGLVDIAILMTMVAGVRVACRRRLRTS